MSEKSRPLGPPEWLRSGRRITAPEIYRPTPLDRKGERLAWSLATALLALLLFLRWAMQIWFDTLLILLGFCTLAAALISFGTWMERNTHIELSPEGLRYKNPLRVRCMHWVIVSQVSVYPRGSGWQALVESSDASFSFQTGTSLNTGWGGSIETGVVGGVDAVSSIVEMASLTTISSDEDGWVCSRQPPEQPA